MGSLVASDDPADRPPKPLKPLSEARTIFWAPVVALTVLAFSVVVVANLPLKLQIDWPASLDETPRIAVTVAAAELIDVVDISQHPRCISCTNTMSARNQGLWPGKEGLAFNQERGLGDLHVDVMAIGRIAWQPFRDVGENIECRDGRRGITHVHYGDLEHELIERLRRSAGRPLKDHQSFLRLGDGDVGPFDRLVSRERGLVDPSLLPSHPQQPQSRASNYAGKDDVPPIGRRLFLSGLLFFSSLILAPRKLDDDRVLAGGYRHRPRWWLLTVGGFLLWWMTGFSWGLGRWL